jgi:hypothetical protein
MRRLLLACITAAALLDAVAAGELRTLFHTAEEREQLDRQRRGEPLEAAPAARKPAVVTGFVKRSDGQDTVWLDGQALTGPQARRLADPAKVREGARGAQPGIEVKPSR